MSKSLGNFLTISDVVESYSADAVRISLANGGDSLNDANFDRKFTDDAILKLYILTDKVESILKANKWRATSTDSKDHIT